MRIINFHFKFEILEEHKIQKAKEKLLTYNYEIYGH